MDLLILIVLVPLILIPIVLLFGFAGCGFSGVGTLDVPLRPTDFMATATGTHSIKLTWTEHAGVTIYDIVRAPIGSGFLNIGNTLSIRELFEDNAIPEDAGTFLYQLQVPGTNDVVADGAIATTIPEAPTLVKLDVDVDQITIVWKNNSVRPVLITLQHRSAGGVFGDVVQGPNTTFTHSGPLTTFTHKGLAQGSAHEYHVKATVGGYDKNQAKTVESAALVVNATTWTVCYRNPLTANGTVDFRGRCLVQKIKKGVNLKQGGSKVRITLRGATNGAVAIVKMSISKAKVTFAANSSQNEWDSEVAPTEVPLVGTPMTPQPVDLLAGILLGNGAKIVLDPVAYNLDSNADLLIAFDIAGPEVSEANGLAAFFAQVPTTEANTFFSPNVPNEAMKQNRSSGPPAPQDYRNNPGSVFIVEQIDVLG